jgi:hypothetical protein
MMLGGDRAHTFRPNRNFVFATVTELLVTADALLVAVAVFLRYLSWYALTEHHALKAFWGNWRYSSTHSLTSAVDGSE